MSSVERFTGGTDPSSNPRVAGAAYSLTSNFHSRASACAAFQNRKSPCFLSSLGLNLWQPSCVLRQISMPFSGTWHLLSLTAKIQVSEAWPSMMFRMWTALLRIHQEGTGYQGAPCGTKLHQVYAYFISFKSLDHIDVVKGARTS